jgi:hypothetical protein
MVQQPLGGQGLTIEVSQSHPDTPYLAGLLRNGDQPDNTQHPQGTDVHAPDQIRTRIPIKRMTAVSLLRPHSHWDQL